VQSGSFSVKIIIPSENDVSYAEIISTLISNSKMMLPLSKGRLLEFFKNGDSLLIVKDDGEFMTHVATTYTYKDGSIELGALYTKECYRNQGFGTLAVVSMVNMLSAKYPGRRIFTLANEKSSVIFDTLGAVKMKANELSSEVWQPCADCPRLKDGMKELLRKEDYEAFRCCDTPYNLNGLMVKS
jgi:N-acetylglutamate synthase-like GNAT family acetyltransferase